MIVNVSSNPKEFFHKLGDMHDACITGFKWEKPTKRLIISLDDLNSNFFGLPKYEGERPVDLVFNGVSSIDIDVQIEDNLLRFYGVEVSSLGDRYGFDIQCSPGGYFKFQCGKIDVVDT